MKYEIIGTSATAKPVKNPDFPGVVCNKLKVCKAYPKNNNNPRKEPILNSVMSILRENFSFCMKNRKKKISTAAKPNRRKLKENGSMVAMASWTTTNVIPQMNAILNNAELTSQRL